MGLFDGGNDWQSAIQGIGATLQDVGNSYQGQPANALQNYNQRLRAQQAMQNLLGTPASTPTPQSANITLPGTPGAPPSAPGQVGLPSLPDQQTTIDATTPQLPPTPGILSDQFDPKTLAMLQQIDPVQAMPLLLARAMQAHKYIGMKPGETPTDEATGLPPPGFTPTPAGRPMTAIEKVNYGLKTDDAGYMAADGTPHLLKETSPRNQVVSADGSIYDISDPKHPKLIATAPVRAGSKPPNPNAPIVLKKPWE